MWFIALYFQRSKKKGSAFRDKPRTEQFGEDLVIHHVFMTGLAEWGTTFVAVVSQMFTYWYEYGIMMEKTYADTVAAGINGLQDLLPTEQSATVALPK